MSIELIPGKWYKNIGTNNNIIAKFIKISNNDFCSDGYCIYKKEYKESGCSGRITSYFEEAEECSLEEIQEYLPENHPDKFTNRKIFDYNWLIPGEIYKTYYPNQGEYIFKHTPGIGNISPYICEYGRSYGISGLFTPKNGFKIFNYTTKEEKAWLEKCISANKFIPKEIFNEEDLVDNTKEYPIIPVTENLLTWEINIPLTKSKLKFIKESDCKEIIPEKITIKTNIKFI